MSTAIRLLMQLIGYVCVATVLTVAGGLFYLWSNGTLDDEKVFQIMAVVHDVDLDELKAERVPTEHDVPPEEPSLNQQESVASLQMRDYELKSAHLQRSVKEFEHYLAQIQEIQERMDVQAKRFDKMLAEAEEKAIERGVTEVVRHWEQMNPAQVKHQIMTKRENGELNEVIMLLTQVTPLKKRKILQQFDKDVEEESNAIYEIEKMLLEGFPKKQFIDAARQGVN